MATFLHSLSDPSDGKAYRGYPKEVNAKMVTELSGPLQNCDLSRAAEGAFEAEAFAPFEASVDLGEQKLSCFQSNCRRIERREAASDFIGIEETRRLRKVFEESSSEGSLTCPIAAAEKIEGGSGHGGN